MPLERQLVDLPIQTGLSQKVDERIVKVGAHTTLDNVVQDKIGQLTKRQGTYDQGRTLFSPWGNYLQNTASGNVDCRLIPNQPDGLAQANGFRLWGRGTASLSTHQTRAYDLDDLTLLVAERFGIEVGPQAFVCFDAASDGQKLLVVWISINSSSLNVPNWCVLDAVTFETLVTPQVLSIATPPDWVKLVHKLPLPADGTANTNAIVAVFQTSHSLDARSFSMSTFSWSAATNLATDAAKSSSNTGGIYDMAWQTSATSFVLSYVTTANPPVIKSTVYSFAFVAGSTNSLTPPLSTGKTVDGLAVWANPSVSTYTWVAYALLGGSGDDIRAYGMVGSTMVLSVADTLLWSDPLRVPYVLSILEQTNQTSILVAGSSSDALSTLHWGLFDSTATWSHSSSRYGLMLYTKLYTVQGKNCSMLLYNEGNPTLSGVTVFPTIYAAELQLSGASGSASNDVRPLATIAPRIANTRTALSPLLPQAMFPQTDGVGSAVLTLGSSIRNASGAVGIDIISAEYNNALWQPAILGEVTYLSGGIPCAFDGQRVTEMGFLYQPPSVSAALAASSGGGLASYTYTYAAVYEWRDATGQRAQSRPTFTTFTSSTSVGKASLSVPRMNLSLRQDWQSSYQPAMAVGLYRDTVAAPGNMVRIYSSSVPAAMVNAYGSTLLTYTDTVSDTSIQYNEALYTNGGVLDAVCPSSLSCLIVHNNRIVGAGDDGVTIWYSTAYDDGTTQPYFNDNSFLVVADNGRITALSSMDGQLIVFKPGTITVIGGDGPTVTGAGASWTSPQAISTDMGCDTDWRSVLRFSGGVIFQNGDQLYLLSRGLEVQYFSGPVEDVLAANPVIMGCANNYARNELRWVCKPTETAETGVTINYNTVTQTWSTFSYYDSDAAAVPGPAIDSCAVIDGVYYHSTISGRVWQENAAANYWDVASDQTNHWVPWTSVTAWAKSNGLQGFGRFWNAMVLDIEQSPHDLTISVGYNYSSSYQDVYTWTASEIASFTTPQAQIQCHLTYQKSESLRVKIVDAAPTGVASTTGQGANVIGVTIEAGVKRGRFRIPEAQAK